MHHIYCNTRFGLCNRLANILNCLYIRDMLPEKSTLNLIWPVRKGCEISFDELLTNTVFDNTYSDYSQIPNHFDNKETFTVSHYDYFKYENERQKYFRNLGFIKPLAPIESKIADFVRDNDINKSVMGIHIRGWELRKELGLDKAKQLFEERKKDAINRIRMFASDKKRVFLISDLPELEERLSTEFPNVTTRKKNTKVLFRKGKKPSDLPHEKTGLQAHRDREQVIDALIDLLVMAKTTFSESAVPSGSYSKMCSFLSKYYS